MFLSIILLNFLLKLARDFSFLAFWLALFDSESSLVLIKSSTIWAISSFPCSDINSPFKAKIELLISLPTASTLDFLSGLVLPNNLSCASEINLEFKTMPNPLAILDNSRLKISLATSLDLFFSSILIAFLATAPANSIPVCPIDCWCSPIICSELATFWSFINCSRLFNLFFSFSFLLLFIFCIAVSAAFQLVCFLFITSWPFPAVSPSTTVISDVTE